MWKTIPGYEGLYQISDCGEVRSLHGDEPRLLKIGYTRGGYKAIGLNKNGVRRTYRINRLVLIAFYGDQPELQACHVNGVRTDNRLENLRWGTAQQNHDDRLRHGTVMKGEQMPAAILTEKIVKEIRELWASADRPTTDELGARYGVSAQTAWKAATRKTWVHV